MIEDALATERETLAAQVRAAYMMGRQEQFKLLLNQNDPAALGRTLTYYEYLTEQRSVTIAAIEAEVSRLQQLVAQIDEESAKLKSLEGDAAREVSACKARAPIVPTPWPRSASNWRAATRNSHD
jgi:septal ring factor EnvC (AmiA/AmiB activator)